MLKKNAGERVGAGRGGGGRRGVLCLQNLLLWHVRMVGEEKAAGAMYAKLTIMVRQNDKKKNFFD